MNNTNNPAHTDHAALAMLCGVVPPEYREGAKHRFTELANQADLMVGRPLPDEAQPGISPPRL